MRVRALQNIKTPQGEIPAGKIIDIPVTLADRLKGKVEVVSSFQGAAEIVTAKGESIWIATEPEDVQADP